MPCLKCGRTNKVIMVSKSSCTHKYNQLVELDLISINKYSETKDFRYLQINKQLRQWIRNIRIKCPPQEELELITNILKPQ